jgi:hypothetical protein
MVYVENVHDRKTRPFRTWALIDSDIRKSARGEGQGASCAAEKVLNYAYPFEYRDEVRKTAK